ncbi:hypothetical protein AB6K26_000187 [Salmonella enterica]
MHYNINAINIFRAKENTPEAGYKKNGSRTSDAVLKYSSCVRTAVVMSIYVAVSTITSSFTGSKLSLREIIPIRGFINFSLSGVNFTTET